MKPAFLYASPLVLLLFVPATLFAHVYLSYPVGGEQLTSGEAVTIQWYIQIAHNTLNWDLYFSPDGGDTWEIIEEDIPYDAGVDTVMYSWTVPAVNTSEGRIWIIQDNEGMDYSDQSLDFTISGAPEPPTITVAAQDLDLACHSANQDQLIQEWLGNQGGAAASNGTCGNFVWSNDYSGLTDDCGSSGFAQVTFAVTDSCGLSAMTTASVVVTDVTPPDIDVLPQDLTLPCGLPEQSTLIQAWINSHGGANASDACGEVSWTHDYAGLSDDCGSTGSATVTFTATDACGNSSTMAAQLTVADTSPPVISQQAEDLVLQCGDADQQIAIQSWLVQHGGAVASDQCGNITWSNDLNMLTDGCGLTGDTVVTFIATDDCGNTASTQASLSITDDSPPEIGTPAQDITVQCLNPDWQVEIALWLDSNGNAEATDDCGSINWEHDFSSTPNPCTPQSIDVTFTATDDCGNASITTATLHLEGTTATIEHGRHDIQLFPNPVNSVLQITGLPKHHESVTHIDIINPLGTLVLSFRDVHNGEPLPLERLTSGVYLLIINFPTESYVRKIVKR